MSSPFPHCSGRIGARQGSASPYRLLWTHVSAGIPSPWTFCPLAHAWPWRSTDAMPEGAGLLARSGLRGPPVGPGALLPEEPQIEVLHLREGPAEGKLGRGSPAPLLPQPVAKIRVRQQMLDGSGQLLPDHGSGPSPAITARRSVGARGSLTVRRGLVGVAVVIGLGGIGIAGLHGWQ
jgi:hypothetical protein